MLIVQKFGGSSLRDGSRLRRAASISLEARRRGNQVLTVVSAAGDSTDELLTLAHSLMPHPPARELDALTATGEQRSAALMAIMLESLGARARSFTGWQAGLVTDSKPGQASIRLVIPARLEECLEAGEIGVVAGFQGIDAAGDITTLGRGGSDTTAVALAAALEAERCEIYTDVDGVYSADPRLVEDARPWERIDYRDMLNLARAGAQVLHAPCVQLAMEHQVPIRLLSSFEAGPGTLVTGLKERERQSVVGITRDTDRHSVTVVGKAAGMGMLAWLEGELRGAGLPPQTGEVGEGFLHFRLDPEQLLPALRLLHRTLFREEEKKA